MPLSLTAFGEQTGTNGWRGLPRACLNFYAQADVFPGQRDLFAMKRVLVLIAGWSLILLGIVGLILPVLQGILFIIAGLTILSSQYDWARRLIAKLRNRFPKISGLSDTAVAWATTWLNRFSLKRKKV